MNKPVIQVENLSKAYQIGKIGTGTISRDIERFWITKILGKEDPFLKIGETNDRSIKGESDIVWSLKDINFEVNEGDAVGIIGKNGAGKSTLLKLLSRVTSPTTGEIRVKGRIASLLEVGTGFHPELSGRENIYLNGAILGMRKKEITSKLDEIIDFSGVERYIDTPVKRYSSGMYVRLAFAVAAHLESEILIVDEVLAVGDAEFQKKCLGKMGDISKGEGRTVLFVSHNMDSIMRLCSKSILMNNGRIIDHDITSKVIDNYLKSEYGMSSVKSWKGKSAGNSLVRIIDVKAHNNQYEVKDNFKITELVGITVCYQVIEEGNKFHAAFNFYDRNGINIFDSHENNTINYYEIKKRGYYETTVWIPENLFAEGVILVGVAIVTHNPFQVHFHERDCIAFNMVDIQINSPTKGEYVGSLPGIIRPLMKWESKNIN
jgi:lipopolysaccharide transport system ATP-binding protein